MDTNTIEQGSNGNNAFNLLRGMVIGGLIGAAVMLLFAPQSGEATRHQIQLKAIDLGNQTSATAKSAMKKFGNKADQIITDVSGKARELKHQGQDVLIGGLERVSAAADTSKKAIQGAQD